MLLTLLLLLLLLLLLWCRSSRRRCRGPIRLEVSKLIAAMTCTSLSTTTIILAPASATAAESAGSYRIDVGADQIVLPSSSHSRLGFSPSKEARAGIVRDRQASSLLEEDTTRLHDIFAKKFE